MWKGCYEEGDPGLAPLDGAPCPLDAQRATWGGAEALLWIFVVVAAVHVTRDRALIALLAPTACALIALAVLRHDWMGHFGFATPLWALVRVEGSRGGRAAAGRPHLARSTRRLAVVALCAPALITVSSLAIHATRAGTRAGVDGDDAQAYLADADSSVLADPKTAQELLARRRFAVPAVAASIDGDEIELDPGDEDARRLLIVAEHPRYRAVLEDPFSEQLVDGINPRLHVTMHQIIANQIWDDTPLEVWQAAQRLRAAGHDRHDILHALAYELSQELHPVLTGQHAPDPDMTAYRDRLRAL